MTKITILNNGPYLPDAWQDLEKLRNQGWVIDETDLAPDISLALLEKGTVEGSPVVMIRVDTSNGTTILLQVTLANLQGAVRLLDAAHAGNVERS